MDEYSPPAGMQRMQRITGQPNCNSGAFRGFCPSTVQKSSNQRANGGVGQKGLCFIEVSLQSQPKQGTEPQKTTPKSQMQPTLGLYSLTKQVCLLYIHIYIYIYMFFNVLLCQPRGFATRQAPSRCGPREPFASGASEDRREGPRLPGADLGASDLQTSPCCGGVFLV